MAFQEKPSSILRAMLPWFARDMKMFTPIGDLANDALDKAVDAVRLGFPTLTPNDESLTTIGRERRIPRAPNETAEAYANRLILWLDLWGLAGLSLGLAYAIQSFVFPGYPRVLIVTRENLWSVLEAGASVTMSPFEAMSVPSAIAGTRYVPIVGATTSPRAAFWQHYGTNFDYDSISNPERAAKQQDYWIVIEAPSYPFVGEYDGSGAEEVTYGDERAIGLDEPFGTFDTMRELVKLYGRAGAECQAIILTPTQFFEPNGTPDASWPNGRWGAESWDVAGVATPTRNLDFRYLLPPF